MNSYKFLMARQLFVKFLWIFVNFVDLVLNRDVCYKFSSSEGTSSNIGGAAEA